MLCCVVFIKDALTFFNVSVGVKVPCVVVRKRGRGVGHTGVVVKAGEDVEARPHVLVCVVHRYVDRIDVQNLHHTREPLKIKD